MRLDSLEGEAREGATLQMSAVAWGVAGMGSMTAQALGRGPNVDMVRAGRRFVEEARWRIGGGEREVIVDERRGKRERRSTEADGVYAHEPRPVGSVAPASQSLIGHFVFRLPAIQSE
jgi:hypothetical protein